MKHLSNLQSRIKSNWARKRVNAFVAIAILLALFSVGNSMAQSSSLTQEKKQGIQLQKQIRLSKALNKAKALPKQMKGSAPSTLAVGFSVNPINSTSNTLQNIMQSLAGAGVSISNVQCNAPDSLRAVGSFSGGSSLFGIGNGLLMTTGSIDNAIGPNKATYTSQDNQMPGYLPMDTLGLDATIIDFDLVSNNNLMTFKYVFASEEYNEYVNTGFNDQFSFFITGPGYPTPTNIALIPGTTTPVSIDNVNLGLNSIHYLNNDTLNGLLPADINRFNGFEYDGLTRVLTTTTLNLVPGATYHLKLVVQDVLDHIYDSGVFLQGGSITSDTCVMSLYPEVTAITDTGNGFDGRIEVYVSGANGLPHAVWNNGVIGELEITNLGPGSYNVVITDDAGCVATLPAPIVLGGGGPVDTCVTPATPGTIDGPSSVCKNSIGIEYSVDPVPGATTYEWTLPTGASGSSSTNVILVNFSSTYTSGDIEVKAMSQCGESGSAALTISSTISTAKPATPGIISGITSGVCESSSRQYSIDAVLNATNYIWTAPAGATIVNGQGKKSVEVAFAPGFISGALKVQASNCAGTSAAKSITLTRVTALPASITGLTKGVCPGSIQVYSCPAVIGADFYNWTLPTGALIENGEGTNSITVSFPVPFVSGKVSVSSGTDCYTSALRTISLISLPAVPSSLTGQTLGVCAGSTQTYTCPLSTTGASSYNWTVPADAIINSGQGTNSISVTFPSVFISGYVAVSAGNDCGQSLAKKLLIRSVPAAPASITGPSSAVCAGSTQTYFCPVSTTGGSSYNWTVPSGALINDGQGTNSISVTIPAVFTSGTISVNAVNSCGQSTAKTLAIRSVTAQPGVITGQASNLCGGGVFNYSIAAVANALSYNWTAPAGCSIDVNGGTNISMTVPSNFVSGTLSVYAVNACGNSTARTLLLNRLPSQPGIITGPTGVCASATDLVFNTTQVGSLTYNWTAPAGAVVSSGQGSNQVSVNWGGVAGNVTVKAANACGISSARSLAVALVACRSAQNVGEEIAPILPSFEVYPNPGTGQYNLDLRNFSSEADMKIYNMKGVLVFEDQLENTNTIQKLDLTQQVPGIYLVRILSGEFQKEIRIVKQ